MTNSKSTNFTKKTIACHSKPRPGKLTINPSIRFKTATDLMHLYTPGVAIISNLIKKHPQKIYDYTIKGNTVAIITNGTAVLGLGNIGCASALPVMEGKALILKKFANINAFPLCITEQDPQKFVTIVSNLTTSFGAINLEDIKAPDCFIIEKLEW